MNGPTERFPFVVRDTNVGAASRMPFIPITLSRGPHSVTTEAPLDSGASVNVLPHSIGLRLGAIWDQQTIRFQLTGNLASPESRMLAVTAQVGQLPPAALQFAWTNADGHPVILGGVNFFDAFDVGFYRTRDIIEIGRASTGPPSP